MVVTNPYKIEEQKWTPSNVYEIVPPNSLSYSSFDFLEGSDGVNPEEVNKSLLDGVFDFFKKLLDGIGGILGGVVTAGGAILSGVVGGLAALIGGIADGIKGIATGIFQPVNQASETFRDGQKSLSDRLDLIPFGFCSAYMDKNVNLEWGGNNLRLMPFKDQLAANRNAHVDTVKSGIVFDKAGTWTVHATLNCRGTAFTGDNNIRMWVSVRRPDNSIFSEKSVQSSPSTNPDTLTLSQPFVVPEAGYFVVVYAWSGRWRWWDGGTVNSGLTAVYQDKGFTNAGQDLVPDETNPNPEEPNPDA